MWKLKFSSSILSLLVVKHTIFEESLYESIQFFGALINWIEERDGKEKNVRIIVGVQENKCQR